MDKRLQALLVVLTFSLTAAARLTIMGWNMLIALPALGILGIFHFVIHFYSMNTLEAKNVRNVMVILSSHVLFATIFLFQIDFGDSGPEISILGNILGIESEFLINQGPMIVVFALIGYVLAAIVLIKVVRQNRRKGWNIKLLVPSIMSALILPNVILSAAAFFEYRGEMNDLESKGQFYVLDRALDDPERVETLTIYPHDYQKYGTFPSEATELFKLKHLILKGHDITSIPDEIADLTHLETLNLLDNKLEEINPAICDCPSLVELRVGGEISSIPDCLKRMKTLRHLSLQSRHANELMEELPEFDSLWTAHFYLYSDPVDYDTMTEAEIEKHRQERPSFDREKWDLILEETGIFHKY